MSVRRNAPRLLLLVAVVIFLLYSARFLPMSGGKRTLGAGLVIYRLKDDGVEYLFLQAANFLHHWTSPKGHVDPADWKTAAEGGHGGQWDAAIVAAVREVHEETGLTENDYQIDTDHAFPKTLHYRAFEKDKTVAYWPAQLTNMTAGDNVTISHEHQAYKWLTLEGLMEHTKDDRFASLRQMMAEIDGYLKGKHV